MAGERADTIACRRLAELPAVRKLRPVVDPMLDTLRVDCSDCRAQLDDPIGLYRPAAIRVRGGKVTIRCDACGGPAR